jgi:hypothetical protein
MLTSSVSYHRFSAQPAVCIRITLITWAVHVCGLVDTLMAMFMLLAWLFVRQGMEKKCRDDTLCDKYSQGAVLSGENHNR